MKTEFSCNTRQLPSRPGYSSFMCLFESYNSCPYDFIVTFLLVFLLDMTGRCVRSTLPDRKLKNVRCDACCQVNNCTGHSTALQFLFFCMIPTVRIQLLECDVGFLWCRSNTGNFISELVAQAKRNKACSRRSEVKQRCTVCDNPVV